MNKQSVGSSGKVRPLDGLNIPQALRDELRAACQAAGRQALARMEQEARQRHGDDGAAFVFCIWELVQQLIPQIYDDWDVTPELIADALRLCGQAIREEMEVSIVTCSKIMQPLSH